MYLFEYFSISSPRVKLGLGIQLTLVCYLVARPVMGSDGCVADMHHGVCWGFCWVSGDWLVSGVQMWAKLITRCLSYPRATILTPGVLVYVSHYHF